MRRTLVGAVFIWALLHADHHARKRKTSNYPTRRRDTMDSITNQAQILWRKGPAVTALAALLHVIVQSCTRKTCKIRLWHPRLTSAPAPGGCASIVLLISSVLLFSNVPLSSSVPLSCMFLTVSLAAVYIPTYAPLCRHIATFLPPCISEIIIRSLQSILLPYTSFLPISMIPITHKSI